MADNRSRIPSLDLLRGFEKQWSAFADQMDRVGKHLKTATNAFDELEGTPAAELRLSARALAHVDGHLRHSHPRLSQAKKGLHLGSSALVRPREDGPP